MKKLITLSMLLMGSVLFAQEATEAPKFTLSGSIDAYYRTNLNIKQPWRSDCFYILLMISIKFELPFIY